MGVHDLGRWVNVRRQVRIVGVKLVVGPPKGGKERRERAADRARKAMDSFFTGKIIKPSAL